MTDTTLRTWLLLGALVAIFLAAAVTAVDATEDPAKPGWYTDPYGTGAAIQLYWDGTAWDLSDEGTRPLPTPTFRDPEEGVCEVDGEPGIVNIDGTCVTAAVYDETYSYENLATVPDPYYLGTDLYGEVSVADTAGLTVENTPEPASERPREFMGEELPSFREILALQEEAYDNPALMPLYLLAVDSVS